MDWNGIDFNNVEQAWQAIQNRVADLQVRMEQQFAGHQKQWDDDRQVWKGQMEEREVQLLQQLEDEKKKNDEMKKKNDEILLQLAEVSVKAAFVADDLGDSEESSNKSKGAGNKRGLKTSTSALLNSKKQKRFFDTKMSSIATTSNVLGENITNTGGAVDAESVNGVSDELRKNLEWQPVTTKTQRKNMKKTGAVRTTPIQLESLDTDKLRKLGTELSTEVCDGGIFVQRLSDNKNARIICETEEAKSRVIEHLKKSEIQFNSYNNKDTKRKSYIVRGMLGEDDDDAIEMIAAAVRATGISNDIVVSHFITPYQRHHPSTKRAPLFRITVSATVDEKLLLDIRTIGYCGVRIELMKKSSVVQCHNCQRHHHTTGQCNYVYRCVQCVLPHKYGECARPANPSLPIGCVNCFDAKLPHGEHTANDIRNCNYYKKMEAGKKERKSNVGNGVRLPKAVGPIPGGGASTSTASRIVGGTSFAQVAKGDKRNDVDLVKLITLTVQGVLAALGHGK